MAKVSTRKPKRLIVARRRYDVGKRKVDAILYLPFRSDDPSKDWVAEFQIKGLARKIAGRVFGVDSLQALLLGAQALRLQMEALKVFSWVGLERNTGIPREIPWSYGREFSEQAEELVTSEALRFGHVEGSIGRKRASTRKRKPGSRLPQ